MIVIKSVKFSEKRAYSFCSENELVTIIRSGEPVMNGFESTESLVTVFSCSDYGGSKNKSSIVAVMKKEYIVPMILDPLPAEKDRWM